MHKLSMLGIALAATAVATPVMAQGYNPVTQGPNAANFQYGYDAGAGFVAFTPAQYQTSGCPIGGTGCYTGPASFLGVYFAPADGNYQGADLRANEITFHPGPDGQLIGLQFVAPTAGRYNFAGTFRAADTPNGNGVIFTTPLGSSTLGVRPASTPFSFAQNLTAGQTARFTVAYNGAYAFDTTGFSLNVTAVPEPASWGLMILGFGVVGAAMRRRSTKVMVAA
jgi:PEP-CTERM motif